MLRKIRVMIVDDSIFFREFMSRSLSADSKIEIVGMASSAREAREKIPVLQPDVITLDIEMPGMRGTEFLQVIRPEYPDLRIVVISSVSNNVFEALQAGAVDFVSKPSTQINFDNAAFIKETISKIHIAAAAALTRRAAAASASLVASTAAASAAVASPSAAPPPAKRPATAQKASVSPLLSLGNYRFPNPKSIVAIGASTGGTEAILSVVRDLPVNTPGIVIVQHMPPVFTRMYAERLDKMCKMSAREARDGDRVEPGLILVAAGDAHMRVRSDSNGYYIKCTPGEKVSGHCPSVDVLFESVAQYADKNAVGIILTGMGADGAKNLLTMKKAGAHTIGQDQASCVVYGMPMVAYNLGAVTEQLPLSQIPEALLRVLSKQ